jgi:predicted GIY-YIG superfamily endonuclease
MQCIVRPPRRKLVVPSLIACAYLLHFHTRFRHAGHYLGATEDLVRRLAEHERGHGSKFMAAVASSGITWELADTFMPEPGETVWELEHRLKGLKDGAARGKNSRGSRGRLCSICRGLKLETPPSYLTPLQIDPLRPRKKMIIEPLPF